MRWAWRQFYHSMATRLMLLGLVLVLVAVVVRYFALSGFLREDLSKVVAEQQLSLARYAAADIDQGIVQRTKRLQQLAVAAPRHLDPQDPGWTRWLSDHPPEAEGFMGGLVATGLNGDVWAAQGLAQALRPDAAALAAARQGEPYVGTPVPAGEAREPMLPLSVPILSDSGAPFGLLTGLVPLSSQGLMGILLNSQIGSASGGFLVISPRDRLFVASSRPEMVLKPTPPEGVNPLHDRAMAGYRGTGVTTNAQGVEEISAMVSVPSTGWFVVARIPTSEALATVGRIQTFVLRNAVLAVLVFSVVFGLMLYWQMRPLFHAADLAERMTLGELPLNTLPVARNDEVGHLIAAFNRLLVKLNAQQAELQRLAHHDPLTGLPNRTLLADRLEQALSQARRQRQAVALLYLDLDGFKPVNDALGHEGGDQVLRAVAQRLVQTVRASDTVARIGGDEFVVLLSPPSAAPPLEAAQAVAQKLIKALAAPFEVQHTHCRLGVSVGIALGDGHSTAKELMLQADHAMYRAKDAGRGRFAVSDVAPA